MQEEAQTEAQEQTQEATTVDATDTNPLVDEARKYRKRAQAAEQQVTALTERWEALAASILEQYAEKQGVKPAALWAAGTTLADVTAEDGSLDPDLIQQAITSTVDKLGLTPSRPAYNPHQGLGQGHIPADTSWAKALNPHHGR